MQNPGSTIDTSSWGTPSAAYPSTTCNTTNFFTAQQVRRAFSCFYYLYSLIQKLVLDITLCGDWAGVPSVYNATCLGAGSTGLCVSPIVYSANGGLTRNTCSTMITLLVRAVPTTITPTLRSTMSACTPSTDSPRLLRIYCTSPAPPVHLSLRPPAIRANLTLVLCSRSHLLSNCSCYALLVQSLFLFSGWTLRAYSHSLSF